VASSSFGGVGNNALLGDVPISITGTHRLHVTANSTSRATGSYQLRAEVLNVPNPPVIDSIAPNEVVSLKAGFSPQIFVWGQDLTQVTSITVGGVRVNSYSSLGSLGLVFIAPFYATLGVQDVIVTTAHGSATASITIVEPASPVLNGGAVGGLWLVNNSISVKVAASPGDLAILFVATVAAPTSVPGILELDIGGGLSGLFQVGVMNCNDAGLAEWPVAVELLPDGIVFQLQAGILHVDTLSLPLEATNSASGQKFP